MIFLGDRSWLAVGGEDWKGKEAPTLRTVNYSLHSCFYYAQ